MRLGNEHLRYLFWSTCLSLRVFDGQNPIRTWHDANLGMRMIFGFETVSWDSGDYGKFFWEEWIRGHIVQHRMARRQLAHRARPGRRP